MSTNFYAQRKAKTCEHCHRTDQDQIFHIGKRSAAGMGRISWAWRIHRFEDGMGSPGEWKQLLSKFADDWVIKDEYGQPVTAADLLKQIEGAQSCSVWNTDFC